jgi:D-inositol-3-phosphate glycosyltransferase
VAELYEGYVEAGRTSISPPGINTEAIERFRAAFEPGPARDALGVPHDATLVFCPGRVVRSEDKVQLLQALVELRGRHPDAHVLLPGTADASAERVELVETYAEAGLRPVLHMPAGTGGHHLYAIADVVLVEGDPADLPFAALAGMAFEKLVVASRLAGLEETIEHGVHGWLWEPNDLGELIEALDLALSASPEEARRVGAAAAARVRERHDARAQAAAIERLLAATPILRAQ